MSITQCMNSQHSLPRDKKSLLSSTLYKSSPWNQIILYCPQIRLPLPISSECWNWTLVVRRSLRSPFYMKSLGPSSLWHQWSALILKSFWVTSHFCLCCPPWPELCLRQRGCVCVSATSICSEGSTDTLFSIWPRTGWPSIVPLSTSYGHKGQVARRYQGGVLKGDRVFIISSIV